MNIDLLIKMANEISAFFAGEDDQEQAARDVYSHLRRFWEPRMRAQIIKYYEERNGAGLVDLSRKAVELLIAEKQAAAPAASSAPSG